MTGRLRPLAALAMVAVISAGCSSAPARTGAGDNATAGHEKAMKFARCMRDNGVKDFPDPDPSGELTVDGVLNGSSLDPNTAAWKNAITACKDLEPPGFTGHKRSAEQQKVALEFARCMRDNGVKDFPDPAPDAPLIDTNLIPSTGTKGGMNILHAAMKQCDGYAKGAGVKAGGGDGK